MSPIAIPHAETSNSQKETSPFNVIPPFPNTVPTAPLLRISLSKLLAGDKEEEGRVWDASRELGFFYLDLRLPKCQPNNHSNGTNGHTNGTNEANGDSKSEDSLKVLDGDVLLKDADELFVVGKEIFELSVDEKRRYDFKDQGSYFGYKGFGEGVVDREGNRDRNEFYNVCSISLSFLI
jgi:hypothetical protein